MQYLLTADELSKLQTEAVELDQEYLNNLQDLCTQVCDLKPIKGWHANYHEQKTVDSNGVAKAPWGCILTRSDWYCDDCPVEEVCLNPRKHWSK